MCRISHFGGGQSSLNQKGKDENREICPLHIGGGQSSLNQKGNDENTEICPIFKTGKFVLFLTLVVDSLRSIKKEKMKTEKYVHFILVVDSFR